MKMVKTSALFMLGAIAIALFLSFVFYPLFTNAATLNRQLEIGMSGADVGILQTYLSKDINVYPAGLVTSYFGPLTKEAVSVFQTNNGISSVGRVGPITLVAINSKLNDSTTGSNRTSPLIRSVNINTTDSGAKISWNTTESASAIVYYDTRPITMTEASPFTDIKISGIPILTNTSLSFSHNIELSGLASDTKYYYALYVRDGFGNVSVTWPSNFSTSK